MNNNENIEFEFSHKIFLERKCCKGSWFGYNINIYKGYHMSIGSILNLLNELNKKNNMRASGQHNNILLNGFNRFSNEATKI